MWETVFQRNMLKVRLQNFWGKKALVPSFADTHLHFASMALFHAGVNVMDASDNGEIQKKLIAFLPKTRAKVVIAFGASPHSVKERKSFFP